MKSYYMREWVLKKEEEKLLIIKFPKENKQALTAFVKKNHPYQIPELVFLQPEDVDTAYLERVHSLAKKPAKK
jgi:periplasmic divalent cation tolerance protein